MINYYQVSPGSCGSCALEELFKGRINTLPWNAHERSAPSPAEGSKVCYLFTDPYNIILSYFRRNFLVSPYDHAHHISGALDVLSERSSWDISSFLDLPEDPFMLESHFDGWYNHSQRNYDIMFLRYDSLKETLPSLCEWYGYPSGKSLEFTFKPRASDWTKQPPHIQEGLHRMYGSFREKILSLPHVTVNPCL